MNYDPERMQLVTPTPVWKFWNPQSGLIGGLIVFIILAGCFYLYMEFNQAALNTYFQFLDGILFILTVTIYFIAYRKKYLNYLVLANTLYIAFIANFIFLIEVNLKHSNLLTVFWFSSISIYGMIINTLFFMYCKKIIKRKRK